MEHLELNQFVFVDGPVEQPAEYFFAYNQINPQDCEITAEGNDLTIKHKNKMSTWHFRDHWRRIEKR